MLIRGLRLAAGLAVLVLLGAGSARAVPGAAAQGDTQGDVTCDSSVNSVDSLQILRDVAGLGTTAGCLAGAGDVNCDGAVNSVDALRILRYVAGLSNTTSDGCTPVGEPLQEPPTSEALISAALSDGDITYEESLLYRAYALYDHPDLPDEFRGPIVDMHAAMALFGEVDQNAATLSQTLLGQLAPFRARPADPASIFNNSPPASAAAAELPTWVSKPAAGGLALVWVKQGPESDAQLTKYANETTRVWGQLPGLIRYGLQDTAGNPDVNPDNAIDLYFVDVGAIDQRRAGCLLNPADPKCVFRGRQGGYTDRVNPKTSTAAAGYVVIDAAVSGDRLTSNIAHELFHTGQFSYDAYDSEWLMDATAAWGEFRVMQKLNASRQDNYDYLPKFFKELDKTLTRNPEGDLNRYASWLYFYFASMQKGDGIVTQIWEAAAAEGEQGERAVDQVFPFDPNFDDFTVRNWNEKPPLTTAYKDKDATFPQRVEGKDLKPSAYQIFFAGPDESKFEDTLEPLSAHYYRHTFGAPVHSVIFHNKLNGKPQAHLWGIAKVDGEWQAPEDWTDIEEKIWCMDVPGQHLDELIVIFSNSDMTGKLTSSESSVEARASGCNNWRGTIRRTAEETSAGYSYSEETVADVYFRSVGEPGTASCEDAGTSQPCETYYASGTVVHNITAVVTQGCTTTISATGTIVDSGVHDGALTVYTDPDPRTYEGGGITVLSGTSSDACPGDDTSSIAWSDPVIWFRTPDEMMFEVKDHGHLIEDTYVWGDYHYDWHLEPAP
jgi:hypothetical protein